MLKYYTYLSRIRAQRRDEFGLDVLLNLEVFPVDLDPSLRECHRKIASRIHAAALLARRGEDHHFYVQSARHGIFFTAITRAPEVLKGRVDPGDPGQGHEPARPEAKRERRGSSECATRSQARQVVSPHTPMEPGTQSPLCVLREHRSYEALRINPLVNIAYRLIWKGPVTGQGDK